jgi:hypothetical protein
MVTYIIMEYNVFNIYIYLLKSTSSHLHCLQIFQSQIKHDYSRWLRATSFVSWRYLILRCYSFSDTRLSLTVGRA